ncbi:MAG: SDR family oxidoreductase [Pseudomonadota bacterium]
MKLKDQRIILTGASGGIGRHLALELAGQGARLALVGRRIEPLVDLANKLQTATGLEAEPIAADLSTQQGRDALVAEANRRLGGVDLLINNAGVVDFHDFSEQDPAMIERLFQTNLMAPILLTRALLPSLLEQGHGRIVNVGSTFGTIGFAYFAAYSGSKFALRGFSQALRRELDGSGVSVSYFAPRAVKTAANSEAVYRMADAIKMNMDPPDAVANFIVQSLLKQKSEAYFGWPEKLFARINAILPGLVDGALRKQNRIMGRFAPGRARS